MQILRVDENGYMQALYRNDGAAFSEVLRTARTASVASREKKLKELILNMEAGIDVV